MTVIALDVEELRLYLDDFDGFKLIMNLTSQRESIDKEFRYLFNIALKKIIKNPELRFWLTPWIIILKTDRTIVGNLCFKGAPDFNRTVEIGYDVDELYWNKGIATEALMGMIEYTPELGLVKYIKAETEWDNLSSQAVLRKCGMARYKYGQGSIWWRIKVIQNFKLTKRTTEFNDRKRM
ncbi:MAG: GNAT family N-acetyltransferase [Clostridia bacterium]|nr:GNAT family N-acetyltransferase [Clostridia bacterium]